MVKLFFSAKNARPTEFHRFSQICISVWIFHVNFANLQKPCVAKKIMSCSWLSGAFECQPRACEALKGFGCPASWQQALTCKGSSSTQQNGKSCTQPQAQTGTANQQETTTDRKGLHAVRGHRGRAEEGVATKRHSSHSRGR